MYTRIATICLIVLQSLGALAHNQWVKHDQDYYKFTILTAGIYRINYTDLTNVGISTADFDPRSLQIFHNGEEIPLFVLTENDGVFHATDYIEFYATGNDGNIDQELYRIETDHVNEYSSLYNDTASYFLTWNRSLSNTRYSSITETETTNVLDYCISTKHINYTSRFNYTYAGPDYHAGEGWVGSTFAMGQNKSETMDVLGYFNPKNIPLSCEYSISTITEYAHVLNLEFAGTKFDDNYYGFATRKGTIKGSTVTNGKVTFSATIPNDGHASTDVQAFSYLRINYPRDLVSVTDTANYCMLPKVGSNAYKAATFSGLRNGQATLYDLTNKRRSSAIVAQGQATFTITNTDNNETYLTIDGHYSRIGKLQKIGSKNSGIHSFTDFSKSTNQANYIIITHSSLWDAAQEYADYRKLTGYTTLVVDVNELYNQFGYGVGKHPIGLRHFAKYAFENWGITPEYIFIIGKGAHAVNYRYNQAAFKNCLVPSAGNPSSDMMTFEGINGTSLSQSIAVGRLAAQSASDVRLYLQKVRDHESQATGEWMKNVLHFGGGSTEYEQKSFKNYLISLEGIVEGDYFGGTVYTTLKNSGDPIEITKSDIVRNKIEEGTSVMTFFGHASSGSFDQSIDEPINFNNKGKYPFILANSCYSGDIFNSGATSVSERWMFIENRGAIAFLASVGTGRPYPLYMYSSELYKNFSTLQYGQSIGKCMQASINTMVQRNDILTNIIAANDFNLHGDPAIKIHSHKNPDLFASENSFSFVQENITAEADSFAINIIPVNIGKSFTDTITISLKRYLPNGTEQVAEKKLYGLQYKDTLEFKFFTNSVEGAGYNKIELFLDSDNQLTELSETNNTASIELFIASRQLVPAYPEEFAIVPSTTLSLYASSLDAHGIGGECYFELDTDHTFSSLSKQAVTLQYDNSLISWAPSNLLDNTTYYWRVGTTNNATNKTEWNASSFRIENGKAGWGQNGYGQSTKNNFTYVEYNATGKLQFTTAQKMLTCTNQGSASNDAQYNSVQYRIDGVKQGSSGYYARPYITIAVIDSVSLEPWDPAMGNMGHSNYQVGGVKHYYFDFRADLADQRSALAKFIRDTVPNGNYVLMYTFISGKFKSWEDDLYTAFEELGASSVRSVQDNYPYIFFVKKGSPATAQEVVGSSTYDYIDLNVRLKSNAHYGYMESTLVGPTTQWGNAEWTWDLSEYDSTYTSIVGIDYQGDEVQLESNFTGNSYDVSQSGLNFQYLKFKTYVLDEESKTPPQFSNWKVYYQPTPETALNIKDSYSFYADTIKEGDTVKLSISTQNISPYGMDSLLVRYSIKNDINKIVETKEQRLDPHLAGTISTGKIEFETTGYSGKYRIKTEFNPEVSETGKFDQIEKYHFNNTYEESFYVVNDGINPVLKVRFDGFRILDRDIVSAKPEIEIEIFDENDFFFIDDTSLISISIGKEYDSSPALKSDATNRRYDCQCKPVYFKDSVGGDQIVFEPATDKDKKAVLRFKPIFTEDGYYVLRVNAKDKKGNEIADSDYEVRFQVILKSTITNIFNYPNPFSTATRFIFTLTGSELPDDFRIQILTISGKLVREIGLSELGTLHIGNNITSFVWDGTDMFGDKLANGVYFYRVFSKIEGQQIERRETAADNFFTKGYGKMVIIR